MKSYLTNVQDGELHYQALAFICPGCASREDGDTGLHLLPVNSTEKSPSWEWDGNLERPTLNPSILTKYRDDGVCHSYLRNGVFEFLSDCTHIFKNQKVEIPNLPEWVYEDRE